MSDDESLDTKSLEEVKLDCHASRIREQLYNLMTTEGIGGMFLLSNESFSCGGLFNIDKTALALFIHDMLKDEELVKLINDPIIYELLKLKEDPFDGK